MAFVVEALAGGDFGAPGCAEVVLCGIEDGEEDLDDALRFGGCGAWRRMMMMLGGLVVVVPVLCGAGWRRRGKGGADEERPC